MIVTVENFRSHSRNKQAEQPSGADTGFWVGLGSQDITAREAREIFLAPTQISGTPPQIGK